MDLGIFLCYRRDDTAESTGRIYERLRQTFGGEHVYLDVLDTSPLGEDFRISAVDALRQAAVMLVVIGREWGGRTSLSASGSRLNDKTDIVRVEIEQALLQGTKLLPVLVEGANMPKERELPKSLRSLVYQRAAPLDHRDWDRDWERIAESIETTRQAAHSRRIRAGAQEHLEHLHSSADAYWSPAGRMGQSTRARGPLVRARIDDVRHSGKTKKIGHFFYIQDRREAFYAEYTARFLNAPLGLFDSIPGVIARRSKSGKLKLSVGGLSATSERSKDGLILDFRNFSFLGDANLANNRKITARRVRKMDQDVVLRVCEMLEEIHYQQAGWKSGKYQIVSHPH